MSSCPSIRIGCAAAFLTLGAFVPATLAGEGRAGREIRPYRIDRPPVVDGRLDDGAWDRPPLDLGEWIVFEPVYGAPAPHPTAVWIAYDDEHIYFALRCADPDPAGLKSGVRRRDAMFTDDFVAILLDTQNSRQSGFQMLVNPHGIQGDGIVTPGVRDIGPDWVWESAARITKTGYDVEIAVPFESVRMPGGGAVRVPIWMARFFCRHGTRASWPEAPPGRSSFDQSAILVFENVPSRRVREVIPSVTYSADQMRLTRAAFGPATSSRSLGASAKFGLTATTAVEATINPDFSQVESDAYQVEVNQRHPVFHSEKRPFFMDGSNLFRVPQIGSRPNMTLGVHTRRIVDPAWGVKVTGTAGRLTFAALGAGDTIPGAPAIDGDASRSSEKFLGIGRLQYSLGPGRNLGAIIADSELDGRFNRVAGADLAYRVGRHGRLGVLALATFTRQPGSSVQSSGAAGVGYKHNARRLSLDLGFQHYGRDFVMDTAYYGQAGFTKGSGLAALHLYPEWLPALKRADVWTAAMRDRDRQAGSDGDAFLVGVDLALARQGQISISHESGREPWDGRRFNRRRWAAEGSVQAWNWLSLKGSLLRGRGIYYAGAPPFGGSLFEASAGLVIEPTPRFSQSVSVTSAGFDRLDTGERVYRLWLLNTRSTYQLTRLLAGRGIVQYDSRQRRVVLDTLVAYELRPGTVVYAGYGSLVERQEERDGRLVPGGGEYITSRRSVFLKASYRWTF